MDKSDTYRITAVLKVEKDITTCITWSLTFKMGVIVFIRSVC